MPLSPSLPELPAFQVVAPRTDMRVDELKLSDGTPMVGADGLLIPAARSFAQIVNSGTRVWSYRYDEAMRDNMVNARAMRRDGFIRGLMEERILPTINREYTLEVDDDRDPQQRYVRDALSRVIKSIPDFDAYKRALLDAVWFGRAGAQWSYVQNPEVDNLWGISRWDPLHGDSVQFTFDGVPAILMDSLTTSWYANHGASWGPQGDLRPTDRGGTALVLHRDYWRNRFAIHVHMREKADYFEGELAGSVQGLGLRGLIYWLYVVRTDCLTWMLAYLQAVGMMDLLLFNYPAGNSAAQLQQEQNAQKVMGKVAIACPRRADQNWPAVEQIPMNAAGLKALHEVVADYFDRHIERLIVGQSMSSGADKGTGLGGTGRAEFAKSTKDEILVYDTGRLDQTLTFDLIRPLKQYNFPWAKFPVRFKSVMPDLKAQEKVASGAQLISVGIPIKVDELRDAGGFSRPEEGDEILAIIQPGMPPMVATMSAQGPIPMQTGMPFGPMLPGGVMPGMQPGGLPNMNAGAPPMLQSGGGVPQAGPPAGPSGGMSQSASPKIPFRYDLTPQKRMAYSPHPGGGNQMPTNYGTKDELIAALRQNPGDLTLRAALADWLDENESGGEPTPLSEYLRTHTGDIWGDQQGNIVYPGQRAVTVGSHPSRGGFARFGSSVYEVVPTRDGRYTWRLSHRLNDSTAGRGVTGPMKSRAEAAAKMLGYPFASEGVGHNYPAGTVWSPPPPPPPEVVPEPTTSDELVVPPQENQVGYMAAGGTGCGMGPGGSNTFLPKFDDKKVGFTRYEKKRQERKRKPRYPS